MNKLNKEQKQYLKFLIKGVNLRNIELAVKVSDKIINDLQRLSDYPTSRDDVAPLISDLNKAFTYSDRCKIIDNF